MPAACVSTGPPKSTSTRGLFFSAITLQVMSSAFNLIGISSFFRDLAWGALLLLSLASGRFDLRAFWPQRKSTS